MSQDPQIGEFKSIEADGKISVAQTARRGQAKNLPKSTLMHDILKNMLHTRKSWEKLSTINLLR